MEIDWGIGLGLVGGAGVAAIPATIGLTMAATTRGEFRFVRACFWLSAALAAILYAVTLWLTGRGFTFTRIAISCAAVACILGGLRIALNWTKRRETAAITAPTRSVDKVDGKETQPPISPVLLESQIRDLQFLNEFIAQKDELGIRETFDLPELLKYNLKFARLKLIPESYSTESSAEIDKFFKGGQARIDIRYATLFRAAGTGAVRYEPIPGKFGILNLSSKFVTNFATLQRYESTSLLPSDVITTVKKLRETIDEDLTLMFVVINERFAHDKNNLLFEDDYSSPYYGATSAVYWERFKQLRPIAEQLTVAMRKYLGIR